MPGPDDPNPSKAQLLAARAEDFDTESLRFAGLRGDRLRHLDRARLERALARLPTAPRDEGRLDLIVARGPGG